MAQFDLSRFSSAQSDMFETALSEIRAGEKRSHWIWFVFPQIAGLGTSSTANHFAIRTLDEARAFIDDQLLGDRYLTAVEALQTLPGGSAERVFGGVDAMKLRSSLTLFEAAGGAAVIGHALEKWFGGERDARTLALIDAD
ncbi:DUF1810 domain-containing protein [Sphingomonas sp. PAMC 26621]|uniref:DUF1810 domain-containing protein n=1 Tax=Sphingomonas sp. PAMC 26621 TaxID=1112213 RepID=UPI00028A018A|nr:DUF1810 domain-containing protein [Sphingomonas sp. PAMC 26621]